MRLSVIGEALDDGARAGHLGQGVGAELDPGAAPGHGEHLGRSEGSDAEDNGLRHTAMGPRGRGQRTGG